MVHPATGKNHHFTQYILFCSNFYGCNFVKYLRQTAYSVVRSLSEAPKYASAIAGILKQGIYPKHLVPRAKSAENVSMQGMCAQVIVPRL